jgi:hypothetical protein
LGIGIILAARKSVNITPVWNEEFSRFFMMNYKHIENCYLEIYSFYESSFPSKNKVILKPAKVSSSSRAKNSKNGSVRTRYTSSDTTNRNNSSTKSSRRSNGIPKIVSSRK